MARTEQEKKLTELFDRGYRLSMRLAENAPGQDLLLTKDHRPVYVHNSEVFLAVYADGRTEEYKPEFR